VFGPHLGFPAAIAAILGFQLNRHHTVYDQAGAAAEVSRKELNITD